MNILLALFSVLSFNVEPMNVTLKEDNVYIAEKNQILIKTINCEEPASNDLAYVTYNENNPFGSNQIQFLNGNVCQISSIEEMTWFQS